LKRDSLRQRVKDKKEKISMRKMRKKKNVGKRK
jgi:hypothetical protein